MSIQKIEMMRQRHDEMSSRAKMKWKDSMVVKYKQINKHGRLY